MVSIDTVGSLDGVRVSGVGRSRLVHSKDVDKDQPDSLQSKLYQPETMQPVTTTDQSSIAADVEAGPKFQRRFLSQFLSKKVPPVPLEDERRTFPRPMTLVVSFLFTWLLPVLRVGYKRTLEPNDLFKLNEDVCATTLAARFEKVFTRRLEEDKQKHIERKKRAIQDRKEGRKLSKTEELKENYRESKGKEENTNEGDEAYQGYQHVESDLDDYVPASTLCVYSVLEAFRWQYFTACFYMATGMSTVACNPLLSRELIKFVLKRALGLPEPTGKGVGYAIGLMLTILVGNMFVNKGFFLSTFTGAELKGLLTKLMLDKSFRLSEKSRKKFPPSMITSIMSTDISRVDIGVGFSPWLFIWPFPAAISIALLVKNIKAPALAGLGVMFLYVMLVAALGTLLFGYRFKAIKFTDIRVGYMKEILSNLKMIKFYSWETPYFNLILETRITEMSFILKMEITRSIIIAAASSLPLLSSFTAFMVLYAASDASERNAATIFPSLTLFGVLAAVFVMLPFSIANGTDAFIGMKRVGDFLAAEEIVHDPERDLTQEQATVLKEKEVAIDVNNGNFEWTLVELDEEKSDGNENKEVIIDCGEFSSSDSDRGNSRAEKRRAFQLKKINFSIRTGEFVVITGQIGSGKSSVLQALNGRMKRNSGHIQMNGTVLMCGTPWLQNTTLRENITFGLPFEENRYSNVIDACALQSDLDILPGRDQTEIGERGITLSGGQKARVSLARAVYSNPDIILLDDVLSAVDSKVGKTIMDDCILGMLKNTTRVLATHQLSLIGSADRVIFLNGDGTMVIGTLDEMLQKSTDFKLLMEHSQTEAKEEKGSIAPGVSQDEKIELKNCEVENIDKVDGKLVSEELKSVNAIGWSVYRRYFAAGAQGFTCNWVIPLILFFSVCAIFLTLFANVWLSFWVEYRFKNRSNDFYIGLYTLFIFGGVLGLCLHFAGIISLLNRSSRILNLKAVKNILHVPMWYMDTTPMGRIINRFTKDTDVLDNEMCDKVAMIASYFGLIMGVIILSIIYLPWFAIAVPILFLVFFISGEFYQASGREVKRVEAVQRSFVYSNFTETLTGLETIKDYKSEDAFLSKNVRYVDRMNEAYYVTVANQRWFDVVLSFLTGAFALAISLLCVFKVFNIGPASAGLLLSYVLQMSSAISTAVVMYTQVEQDMNSTERIMDYAYDLPKEAAFVKSETAPAPDWPQHGQIEFKDVTLSYRPGLPPALKHFSAKIKPYEKVGICGRTGAGKSSIMVCLYRLVELTHGKISIDGLDVSQLGLHDLRLKLSIIPQDPVLFRGTIRSNLDPFKSKTDEQLWRILLRARIIDTAEFEEVRAQNGTSEHMHKFHLDLHVEDEGANFSLGERQCVAFARALVRGSKILIMDEATSSVDYATDSKLQTAIVEEFSECTILCVAHRLKTILEYDRILVLDHGTVEQFDTPWKLYSTPGIFRQMCEKSRIYESHFRRK